MNHAAELRLRILEMAHERAGDFESLGAIVNELHGYVFGGEAPDADRLELRLFKPDAEEARQ